jgi:cytochrome b561
MHPAGTPPLERYSRPAIFFHWAIVVLIALGYLAIEIRGPKGSESRAFWSSIHFTCGVLVLSLAVLRVIWRLWRGAPAEASDVRVLTFMARLVHLMLYVFIFLQPILGILTINTGGHPVVLAGLGWHIQVVGADQPAQHVIEKTHKFLGNLFYWIIGLHALAAIGHQVVLKDGTLRRMI